MGDSVTEHPIAAAASAAASIRKAGAADVPELAAGLARAFYSDAPMGWFLPDDATRMEQATRLFAVLLRRFQLSHDLVWMIDSPAGGAIWLPPGHWLPGPLGQLGMLPAMLGIFGSDLYRALRGQRAFEVSHPKAPHYYLETIGVEPAGQGRGLGAALMRPMLERCDREGVPAYLEASSTRSRDLYARHGFELTEPFHLPDGGPPLYCMWREPRPA